MFIRESPVQVVLWVNGGDCTVGYGSTASLLERLHLTGVNAALGCGSRSVAPQSQQPCQCVLQTIYIDRLEGNVIGLRPKDGS